MSTVEPITDLSRIAIHTVTTKPWPLETACAKYKALGFGGVCVWDDVIDARGVEAVRECVSAADLKVPALVRGGFFVANNPSARSRAVRLNRLRIKEAAEIGAKMIVLVVGAQPDVPLDEARQQVTEAIGELLPDAESLGVQLAIEPLHPMYAADRSCINRIAEARVVCDELQSSMLGVAVDVYHVWWDPELASQIEALGHEKRLFGFHVCDWRVETRDMLLDRGLMGDGVIDLRGIRQMVESAGFDGMIEVEVFSNEYWAMDQDEYLKLIQTRVLECI